MPGTGLAAARLPTRNEQGDRMLFSYKAMRPAEAGTKTFLYIAAAFNFGAGASLPLLARWAPGLLGIGPPTPDALLFVDVAAWLVVAFGIGYALGGHDLTRHWPFIALGALGKAGVAVLVIAYFLAGIAGPLLAVLAAADAVFAVLFIRLLRTHAV
jgi:hypothetical protein